MKLVTVASFETPAEAHMAVNMLAAEGIRQAAQGENIASTAWHWGTALGGVKVQVAEVDSARAAELLASAGADARTDEASQRGDWTCHKCGERVTADFAICWACGTAADGTEDPAFALHRDDAREEENDEPDEEGITAAVETANFAPAETTPVDRLTDPTHNPYASPRRTGPLVVDAVLADHPEREHQERLVEAGWRASIVGILFFMLPVFSLYSGWLLLRATLIDGEMNAATGRKFYAAMAVDLVMVGVWSLTAFWFVG